MLRTRVRGYVLAVVMLATTAWALEVGFSRRTKAKAAVVVDELGRVLFGSQSAKVEVTKLPSPAGGEEFFSVTVVGNDTAELNVTTVPSDKRLVITDIDGDYSCNYSCEFTDATSVRLNWAPEYDFNNYATIGQHRSYTTGLAFNPGQTVVWRATAEPEFGSSLYGHLTVMGKLIPTS